MSKQKSKSDNPVLETFGYMPSVYSKDVLISQKESFLEVIVEASDALDFLADETFIEAVEAYNITEELAMEWMVEDGNFVRLELNKGWRLTNPYKYKY